MFLHVLTAADARTEAVPVASATVGPDTVILSVGTVELSFLLNGLGGTIKAGGNPRDLAETVVSPTGP